MRSHTVTLSSSKKRKGKPFVPVTPPRYRPSPPCPGILPQSTFLSAGLSSGLLPPAFHHWQCLIKRFTRGSSLLRPAFRLLKLAFKDCRAWGSAHIFSLIFLSSRPHTFCSGQTGRLALPQMCPELPLLFHLILTDSPLLL